MKLRRFNEAWIKAFREQLADLRANPKHEIPSDPLEHRDFTEVVTPESHVAPEHLQTKCEAARYLIAVLNKLRPEPCIFEAIDRLYWDESLRTHRRGITATKTAVPVSTTSDVVFHSKLEKCSEIIDRRVNSPT